MCVTDNVLAIPPEEAFRRIGVSRALGYKLIKNGTIKAVRLGERRLLVPIAALEELLSGDNKKVSG